MGILRDICESILVKRTMNARLKDVQLGFLDRTIVCSITGRIWAGGLVVVTAVMGEEQVEQVEPVREELLEGAMQAVGGMELVVEGAE